MPHRVITRLSKNIQEAKLQGTMCEHLPGMYVEFVTVPVISSNSHKYHNKDYYCDDKDCKECCHHSTYDGCSRICRLTKGVTKEPDSTMQLRSTCSIRSSTATIPSTVIQYCMYCRVSRDSIRRDSTNTQYMIIQKILSRSQKW